jgi:hypothetical protein
MMCSTLAFQEPSTKATPQRDGWAVRPDVHVTPLFVRDMHHVTVTLHLFNDPFDCGW